MISWYHDIGIQCIPQKLATDNGDQSKSIITNFIQLEFDNPDTILRHFLVGFS